jgi:L-iditol 2-dehydrogenase
VRLRSALDDAVDAAIRLARPGARVVLIGIPAHDRTTFSASLARRKSLTLVMSRRMTKTVIPRAIHLVERGIVDVDWLATNRPKRAT